MRSYHSFRFFQIILLQLTLILCSYNNHAYGQIKQLDRSTLEEMTEDRTEDGTEFNLFLSRSNNYISLGVPVSLFVAGAITGAGSAWLTYRLNKWMKGKRNKYL